MTDHFWGLATTGSQPRLLPITLSLGESHYITRTPTLADAGAQLLYQVPTLMTLVSKEAHSVVGSISRPRPSKENKTKT
jgi:hypothetical protein